MATIEENAFGSCNKLTIYGNDGQTSKAYAESNNINFKYISQWDESDIGDDITSPSVESIIVPYSSVLNYYDSNSTTYIIPTGKVLIINVNFSENIVATSVPTLTIKFGNGKNIALTNGTVSGSTIAYTYTIASGDTGTMTVVSLSGGNVADAAGNEATLSCPALKVQTSNHYIYANGTAVDVDDNPNSDSDSNNTNSNNNGNSNSGNNSNNNDSSNSGNNNNSNGNNNSSAGNNSSGNNNSNTNSSSSNSNNSNKDTTISTEKLPNTGLSIGLFLAIIVLLSGCTFAYFKYNNLRGI